MAGVTINLDLAGVDEQMQRLRALGPAGEKAGLRATRKVVKWIAGQLAADVSRRADIPRKALTVGGSSGKGKRIHTSATSVWMGYAPMQAAYVTPLRSTSDGASARGHAFPGYFVARMPSGHTSIWLRNHDDRLFEAEVDFEPPSLQVVDAIEQQAGERLERAVDQELNYALNHEVDR